MKAVTVNSIDIQAPPQKIYDALLDPEALQVWQAPDNMRAKMHVFTPGKGYTMSLFYTTASDAGAGKTAGNEDRFSVRFLELVPGSSIKEAIQFDTDAPGFEEEMLLEIALNPIAGGTRVVFRFSNLPGPVRPEDNEAGTAASLRKLAAYMAQQQDDK